MHKWKLEANERFKHKAEQKGVKLWQVADKFGVTDATFSRWLRHEFTEERMKQALQFVDEIAEELSLGDGAGV